MKILNNNILNKAATFLLTAVLLCCNAVQVNANSLNIETFTANIIYRDSGYQPRLVSSYINGNEAYFCYEDTIQLVVEPVPGGYTYLSCLSKPFDFNVKFTALSSSTINVQVTDVSVIVPGFSAYKCDFYGNYENSLFIDDGATVSLPLTITPELGFPIFYNELPTDIVIEVGVRYNVSLANANVQYPQHFFWFEYNFDGISAIDLYRTLGDHRSLQLDSIIDQNNSLIGRLTSWFEDLFQRMDDKQNELINGYQDTTTSEAASAFSSESDKLSALEGELSTQSNTYVSDYAAAGFDLGVLGTLGSSLIFVTTWFTNFWNMGGVFTACLNFCFALSIVFFILRIKR